MYNLELVTIDNNLLNRKRKFLQIFIERDFGILPRGESHRGKISLADFLRVQSDMGRSATCSVVNELSCQWLLYDTRPL